MSNDNQQNRQLAYGEMIPKLAVEDTNGKPAALTIRRVDSRNLAPKTSRAEEWKLVIEFAEEFSGDTPDERRREYVVNSTSYKTLCDRLGKDHTKWIGKQVVMAPTNNTYEGRTYEKLHVAAPERWDKVIGATATRRVRDVGKK
jgi:hypothetical protein